MRLKEAYKLNREHSISKNISEFGAVPSNPDNTAAFAKAVVWLNEQTEPACLVFGPGIYSYETSPNWAVSYATITSCGVVRLRNTGTGDAFILDGGAAGIGITGMHVGRFLIEGHDGSGDGVYIRAVHRSSFSFNIRGCGATQAALRTEWCVVDEFQITTSVNEGGWYNDGTGEAEPLYGAYLDERGAGEFTAYCTFINPIIEGTGEGCRIENGIGNIFYGGAMEGCVTYGLNVKGECNSNKVYGTDFEVNGTANCLIAGAETELHGADSDGLVKFTTDGGFNGSHSKIIGGANDSITVDSGVVGVKISDTSYNRTGSGVFTDNGTNTQIRGLTNITTAVIIPGYVVPTSLTVVTGGTPVGTIADLQVLHDGSEYNLPEVSGTPGMELQCDFTNIKSIRGLVLNARYTGSSSHEVVVRLKNYTGGDDTFIRMASTATNNYRTILIPDDTNYMSSGAAQVSFYHAISGVPSHDLYIDYIALIT